MHRSSCTALAAMAGLAIAAVALSPSAALGTGEAISRFEAVQTETYRHTHPGFTLQYPYELRTSTPTRKGEVFSASGPSRVPSLNVMVLPRPADLPLAQAAQAAAKQLAPNGTIKAQRAVDLGGVAGEELVLEWSMPVGMGVELRSVQVSAFHGDAWVVATVTDGRAGDAMAAPLSAAANSLRFTQ